MSLAKNGGLRLSPPFSFLVEELKVGEDTDVAALDLELVVLVCSF